MATTTPKVWEPCDCLSLSPSSVDVAFLVCGPLVCITSHLLPRLPSLRTVCPSHCRQREFLHADLTLSLPLNSLGGRPFPHQSVHHKGALPVLIPAPQPTAPSARPPRNRPVISRGQGQGLCLARGGRQVNESKGASVASQCDCHCQLKSREKLLPKRPVVLVSVDLSDRTHQGRRLGASPSVSPSPWMFHPPASVPRPRTRSSFLFLSPTHAVCVPVLTTHLSAGSIVHASSASPLPADRCRGLCRGLRLGLPASTFPSPVFSPHREAGQPRKGYFV